MPVRKEDGRSSEKWGFVSARILKVKLESVAKEKVNLIILYGSNEYEKITIKDKFLKEVTDIVENIDGIIVVLGDLNGWVGKWVNDVESVIGKHGENVRNSNGRRIINFCMQNNFLVLNTFFQRKEIHSFRRVVNSKNEKL